MIAKPSRRAQRVLYVIKSSGGGSLINVLELVRNLDQNRFRPMVLFYRPNPYVREFERAGAVVRCLESGGGEGSSEEEADARRRRLPDTSWLRPARQLNGLIRRDLPRARAIARSIREVRADLVQSNVCPSADRATILAAGLARVPQLCYAQYYSSRGLWIDRRLCTLVDRYLCISEAIRQQLRRDVRVPEDKTRLVYAPFQFADDEPRATLDSLRRSLGANGDEVLLANIGRIVPWKGQDVFIKAFGKIARDYPHARAVVVGSHGGKQRGRAWERELRQLVRDLHLEERVRFTGHRDDVDDVMAAADVIVHSSSEPEPLGRVIMEAIALRRPVVATSGGGVPEMIEEGVTGFLAAPGDPDGMAQALARVLSCPDRAATMAEHARARARGRFSSSIFVRLMQQEYDRVLEGLPFTGSRVQELHGTPSSTLE